MKSKLGKLRKYIELNFSLGVIGDIKWSHATNSLQLLSSALKSPVVHFIEVDVSLSDAGELIAAHPPGRESDLPMNELLARVKDTKKGLKLDFKKQETVIPCLELLAKSNLDQPIILNADILSLPGAPAPAIEAEWFMDTYRSYSNVGILSLGWRTVGNLQATYSSDDINKILGFCAEIDSVTFSLRASLLPKSYVSIDKLLEEDSYTLTIWDIEPISAELYDWIRQHTDEHRCFYDVSVL